MIWLVAIVVIAVPVRPQDTGSSSAPIALGNLAVVVDQNAIISTPERPAEAKVNDLWCEAREDDVPLVIDKARFVRLSDRVALNATIDTDVPRARLRFGTTAAEKVAGKYRCEIESGGRTVHGNMFVYSRPIVVSDDDSAVKVSADDLELVIGKKQYGKLGDAVRLVCPVAGYPHPNIDWYRGGETIEEGEGITIRKGELRFADFKEADEGWYRCVATNHFPSHVDGQSQHYFVKFELELKAQRSWIVPLIVIIIILLLLFAIIYACQACKRYKHNRYNVAKRERTLHVADNAADEED